MNGPTECNIMFDVEDSKAVMPPSDDQPGQRWDRTRYMVIIIGIKISI